MSSLVVNASVWKACLCILMLFALISVSVTEITAAPLFSALQAVALDCDNDGLPDEFDPDDDNDGLPDSRDPATCDPSIPGPEVTVVPEPNDPTGDKDNDGIPDDIDPDDGENTTPGVGDGNGRPATGVPVVAALPSTGSGSTEVTLLPLATMAVFAVSRFRSK